MLKTWREIEKPKLDMTSFGHSSGIGFVSGIEIWSGSILQRLTPTAGSMLAKNSLSVIIPYYKRRYFDRTLACLAGQEDKSFLVFIGDDGSPEDCCSLIEKYSGSLTIKYRRYTENIGHRSLVSHWNRCVRDTTSDWVWLFSDDDIASSDCVGSFRESLDETEGRYNVYRFPTKIIDGSGAIIHCPPLPPRIE